MAERDVPFDDEISAAGVLVVPDRPSWRGEFELLGGSLASVLGALARRIDHVGSTSAPGLAAKDCLDVQVSVDDVAAPSIDARMTAAGYRQRPEPWGEFKLRLARSVPDIYDYGQIKTPATEILMQAAARWADEVDWTP